MKFFGLPAHLRRLLRHTTTIILLCHTTTTMTEQHIHTGTICLRMLDQFPVARQDHLPEEVQDQLTTAQARLNSSLTNGRMKVHHAQVSPKTYLNPVLPNWPLHIQV